MRGEFPAMRFSPGPMLLSWPNTRPKSRTISRVHPIVEPRIQIQAAPPASRRFCYISREIRQISVCAALGGFEVHHRNLTGEIFAPLVGILSVSIFDGGL